MVAGRPPKVSVGGSGTRGAVLAGRRRGASAQGRSAPCARPHHSSRSDEPVAHRVGPAIESPEVGHAHRGVGTPSARASGCRRLDASARYPAGAPASPHPPRGGSHLTSPVSAKHHAVQQRAMRGWWLWSDCSRSQWCALLPLLPDWRRHVSAWSHRSNHSMATRPCSSVESLEYTLPGMSTVSSASLMRSFPGWGASPSPTVQAPSRSEPLSVAASGAIRPAPWN